MGDESVCYEVVIGLHAEVVEGLQPLADGLGDGCDLCRLLIEYFERGAFFEALLAVVWLIDLPEDVVLA